jgi:peptidoglycan/LPS O-acetylase OafA/YrhL
MKLVQIIEWLRARLRWVVRFCLAILAVLVLLDAVPGVVDKSHAHTEIERWPGFWAIFGVVGCAFLIVVSKAFGKLGIMRKEDYYDE